MKAKWWQRLLYRFARVRYTDGENGLTVKYKALFGHVLVLSVGYVPPQHPNCRCCLEVNGKEIVPHEQ